MKAIIIWIFFIFLNIGWGILTSYFVNKQKENKTYKSIKHGWWGLVYVILMCVTLLFFPFNFKLYCLLISLALLHLAIFPPIYNLKQKLYIFNLSKTSKALTDRFMVLIGLQDTKAVSYAAIAISVSLLIHTITK